MKELSRIAKKYGIKTEWDCWENGSVFSDYKAMLEICKRIEAIEEITSELKIRNTRYK